MSVIYQRCIGKILPLYGRYFWYAYQRKQIYTLLLFFHYFWVSLVFIDFWLLETTGARNWNSLRKSQQAFFPGFVMADQDSRTEDEKIQAMFEQGSDQWSGQQNHSAE